MFLTLDQIKQFTSGAVTIEKENGVIYFDRFAEVQQQAFKTTAERFYPTTRSTTGVRIDFHTDSAAMILDTCSGGKYEILVNDNPRFQIVCEEAKHYCMEFEPGDKRITIVLPSHRRGSIGNIRLNLGSKVWAHTYDKKLLFIGDSITQGWNSKWDCLSFTHLVTRFFNADAINWGLGGSWLTPSTVANVGFDADAVIVAYGTNDFGACRSIEHFRENCSQYLANLRAVYPNNPIFCITPIWRADGKMIRSTGTVQDVRDALAEEAAAINAIVIDGPALVPHMPEFYADEYLHPNDQGFTLYAQNLIRELQKHI